MPDQSPIAAADAPGDKDIVQVLMTEEMARRFEERCLGVNTRGMTRLSPPILFSEDDLPTYIIQIDPPYVEVSPQT
jgi:hypothetical protein